MSHVMRSLALGAIMFVTAQTGWAQESPGHRALAIPTGQPVKCEVMDMASIASGKAVVRQFKIGVASRTAEKFGIPEMWPREITAAFDSSGRLVLLSDLVMESGKSTGEHVTLAEMQGRMTGHRSEMRTDTTALAAAKAAGDLDRALAIVQNAPQVSRDLSDEEVVQARALGAWLAKQKCP